MTMAIALFIIGLSLQTELILTVTINRHGMRTPSKELKYLQPNDQFSGFEILTTEGYLQMYMEGEQIINEFKQLYKLPSEMQLSQIYTRCTAKTRTYGSAHMLNRGMYSKIITYTHSNGKMSLSSQTQTDIEGAKILEEIPIYMMDGGDDMMLRSYKNSQCSSLNNAISDYKEHASNGAAKYSISPSLRDKLSLLANSNNTNKIINSISHVIIALRHERLHSVKFTEDEVKEMDKLEIQSKSWLFDNDGYIPRISTSYFWSAIKLLIDYSILKGNRNQKCSQKLEQISEYDPQMNSFLSQYNNSCNLSYVLYSAHDYTLIQILESLGIKVNAKPDFGSIVSFQIYKDVDDYSIQILYNFKPVELPFCNANRCGADQFKNYISNIITQNICNKESTSVWPFIMFGVVGLGALVLLIIIRKNKTHKINYPSYIVLHYINMEADSPCAHYYYNAEQIRKFNCIYTLILLGNVTGKAIIHCPNIDKAFHLKLFFDRFNIKSNVLNTNLPKFNQESIKSNFKSSIFTYLIAYSVTGLKDLPNVTNIIMVSPVDAKTYRALQSNLACGHGTMLTFSNEYENKELNTLINRYTLAPFPVNEEVVNNFKYRCDDVFRSIKKKHIKQEKEKEVSSALFHSSKLKEYFEKNPIEKEMVFKKAHCTSFPSWKFRDLHKIPSYLVPKQSLLVNNIEKALQKEKLEEKSVENVADPFYYETPLIVDADRLEPTCGRKRWMVRHKKGNKKKKVES